jgi:hypothetical protein
MPSAVRFERRSHVGMDDRAERQESVDRDRIAGDAERQQHEEGEGGAAHGGGRRRSEIEHGVEPAVDAGQRRDLADREQRAVDIRAGAAARIVADRQPLVGHPNTISAPIT